MRQRLLMAVGMSLLLVAALMPAAAMAAGPERFGRVDTKKHPISQQLVKELLELRNPNRKVMVFVELTRPSVADAIAANVDAGLDVSEGERAQLRAPLRAQQDAVRRSIERLNGRVHASFTDVLNGFRATVPAGSVAELSALAGVKQIHAVSKYERTNDNSARFLKASKTWKNPGFTGDGVVIAVIDTGINYYHKDFAGTGEPDNTADNPAIVEPGSFPTAKVIGGWDFVGDAYDGDNNPMPDPDPKDCNGHGTHVAGTAAGMGVTSDGSTYTGPYTPAKLNGTNWNVPPGMAPEALLLAYKIFGCGGFTNIVLDAIERSVRDGADVINMSIGSDFGNGGRIEEIAVNNAVRSGVVVVASAGNSGPSAYITGSPASADGAISVAALDGDPLFPSVKIDMPTGSDIRAINANGDTDNLPVTGDLNHFEDNPATPCDSDSNSPTAGQGCEQLGSWPQDYVYNGFVAGQIAVTHRGVTARISRAQQGDDHGASAVIMINNTSGYPPFEGDIDGVDIPFLGVPSGREGRFHTDDGGEATIREARDLANPNYGWQASFSSGGFRRYDQLLKPDVIAPGVSVISADTTDMTGGVAFSGTSMSGPAVAGVAALVVQARPELGPKQIKSLIVNTATPGNVKNKDLRIVGAGAPDALRATTSRVHITVPNPFDGPTQEFQASLAFGLEEIVNTSSNPALSSKRSFRIWNKSTKAVTYNIQNQWATPAMGLGVSVSPSSVTVPANSSQLVTVTITMSKANAAALSDAAPFHGPVIGFDVYGQFHLPLEYIGGRLLLKPTKTSAGITALRVPWAVVPRGTSNVWPAGKTANKLDGTVAESTVRVRNSGIREGWADFFQWGLTDQREGYSGIDIHAAGVQSLGTEVCTGETKRRDRCLVFALNMWTRFSNASENLYIIPIDVDGDGSEDYELWGLDGGFLNPGLLGVFVSAVVNLSTGRFTAAYFATAPANGSTVLMPALASDFRLSESGDDDFEYYALAIDLFDAPDDPGNPVIHVDYAFTGSEPRAGSMVAHYNAFDLVISNGHFVSVPAGGTIVNVDVWVDAEQYDPQHGHKGWMIVTLDDPTGDRQADLVQVGPMPAMP